ncbi:hypothetical protein LTR64_002862 [Lithohypha guttulata]|uniref:uncharacterized protein n=1 Tax=Lithohypha guttulata TaxID=1690604 RepID=UPI00315CB06D
MSMLAGAGPNGQTQPATDELKNAAFTCIGAIIEVSSSARQDKTLFQDQGTRNIADQLVYLLLESITDDSSEQVQLKASEALLQLIKAIRSRVFLASLLPRTVSSLVKALKLSTTIRRTQKVLVSNVKVLRMIIIQTLSDRVATTTDLEEERQILDNSWLKATSTQIKNALIQHEGASVRRSIEELCVVVLEECQVTLSDSMPVVLESLVVLASLPEGESAQMTCRHIVTVYPNIAEILQSNFLNWSNTLPRLMQSQNDEVKEMALRKLTVTLPLLAQTNVSTIGSQQNFLPMLIDGVSNLIQESPTKTVDMQDVDSSLDALSNTRSMSQFDFQLVLLNHEAQKSTTTQLQRLVKALRDESGNQNLVRSLTDIVAEADGATRLAALWLALEMLKDKDSFTLDDLLVSDIDSDQSTHRARQLAELHATTFESLSSVHQTESTGPDHWRFQALALEVLVLYAQSHSPDSFRSELVDTLYPVLSLLASPNSLLRSHAMTALNKLASICQYHNTQDLLIQNADYLVNSIAWKLNTYSLSPEAPQLLGMMVHLCGAEIVPYVDDLIQLIFAALDNYHGYSALVETLFSTLKKVIDVSVKQPLLAITQGQRTIPNHAKTASSISRTSDVLSDLRARKQRKVDFGRPANEPPATAPHRPWTDALDGPSFTDPAGDEDGGLTEQDSDQNLAPLKNSEEAEEHKKTKSHTLLLNIAKSTVPHMTSPSPRVRQVLLGILKDISPLLAGDENSFLPLVNNVWPVVVSRLFADEGMDEETAYNTAAAADTIAVLCTNASDFMSSRIERISEDLIRLWKQVRKSVLVEGAKGTLHESNARSQTLATTSVINLHVSNTASSELSPEKAVLAHHFTRTSKMQIFNSLVNLVAVIVGHVRLSLDTRDALIRLLLPFKARSEDIGVVLQTANADWVWLYQLRYGDNGPVSQPLTAK